MAEGHGFALAGLLAVLPTPLLAVNILFAVALFTLPGAMVWLDRQDRMPLRCLGSTFSWSPRCWPSLC